MLTKTGGVITNIVHYIFKMHCVQCTLEKQSTANHKDSNPLLWYLIYNFNLQVQLTTITYRNWKSVDMSVLRCDIAKSFDGFTTQDTGSAVKSYNSVLKDIVDKYAPEKLRVIVVRADAQWYTSEFVKEKRLRRKLERKYNNTKL